MRTSSVLEAALLRRCCAKRLTTLSITHPLRSSWHHFSTQPPTSSGGDGRSALPASRKWAAEEVAAIAPMVLLRQALQQFSRLEGSSYAVERFGAINHTIIPRFIFDDLCVMCHVQDSQAALDALDRAAIVVSLDDGRHVHLRPVQYVQYLHMAKEASEGAQPTSSEAFFAVYLEVAQHAVDEAEHRFLELHEALLPAIDRAARWRRTLWGGALFYAGAQLAAISRLTYFDLSWDIMEPISYGLGIGTALLFFGYFMWYDEAHTYAALDRRFVPQKVRKYAPKDFDWNKYETARQQLEAERRTLTLLKEWLRTH